MKRQLPIVSLALVASVMLQAQPLDEALIQGKSDANDKRDDTESFQNLRFFANYHF